LRITRRQMEFLRHVKQLGEGTNSPVHYTTVAAQLGVSKWSAYEMLKALERQGLLASQYEVKQGGKFPGRAMVLFSLTNLADEMLSAEPFGRGLTPREWGQVRRTLLSLSKQAGVTDPSGLIEHLLTELPMLERPIVFSAYVITMLATELINLGEKSIDLLTYVTRRKARAETILVMFVGTVAGAMLRTTSKSGPITQVSKYASRLVDALPKLSEPEQTLLMDFLEEVLKGTGLAQVAAADSRPDMATGLL